jgi:branched-chain amino acid transport system substrate-binding protein
VSFTSNSFDAAMLLAIAAQWATGPGSTLDGVHMATALTHVSSGQLVPLDPAHFTVAASEMAAGRDINVEGASGHLDFNPTTGEAPAAIEVWRVADGGFTTEAVVTP